MHILGQIRTLFGSFGPPWGLFWAKTRHKMNSRPQKHREIRGFGSKMGPQKGPLGPFGGQNDPSNPFLGPENPVKYGTCPSNIVKTQCKWTLHGPKTTVKMTLIPINHRKIQGFWHTKGLDAPKRTL